MKSVFFCDGIAMGENNESIFSLTHYNHFLLSPPFFYPVFTRSFAWQVAVFIEYPFCKGGNLSYWLKAGNHKPWELQGVARQLLYGIMYLHDHGVIHKVGLIYVSHTSLCVMDCM